MKLPAFQFYPGDWLQDASLRMVSVAARGLWIDVLCLMHQGQPYGHLTVAGKVILPPNLARIVGATLQEVEGWLSELEGVGVFSKTPDGVIFSRRMIRDQEIRLRRAAGGILGGNPALKNGRRLTLEDNLGLNLTEESKDNQNPTPSSSSSSSSSSSELITPLPPCRGKRREKASPDVIADADRIYGEYPRKVGKPNALKAIIRALKKESFEVLIERTQGFASKWTGGDTTYCPHPATWFNQERYNDSPETWGPNTPGMAIPERIALRGDHSTF